MFRFPRDVKVYIFFNYLISGNEIFQLKLKNTKHFRDRLKYQIEHIKNSECGNWLNNDTQISLLVDKGVTYINLYNDEVCSTNIKFNLKNTDLEFQRVKNL
ncbi:hypothetical protein C8P68_101349 [Mucilaginibacter yixingensis]|uniref:Uncharacterized protein n=2 Tax=Mucilaginibacter yixingensis TaxID=1295612 RepID=A0A2T5JFB1_9SPHI|nr:hypothetical protein C8P68_101349 [Mucilaginibacter yixingensis]